MNNPTALAMAASMVLHLEALGVTAQALQQALAEAHVDADRVAALTDRAAALPSVTAPQGIGVMGGVVCPICNEFVAHECRDYSPGAGSEAHVPGA